MIGRLQQAADFQRLLQTPPRRRSAHFCVHFVQAQPARAWSGPQAAAGLGLSTASESILTGSVDNSPVIAIAGCWLGCMVPKRHAKRAVTRSLLKRQMRAAAERNAAALAPGMWLVRLRSGFPPSQFPSAASSALREVARQELDALLQSRGKSAT